MKKVVYTCLFGHYDDLKDPIVIKDDWDYICFSNHLNQSNFNIWQIKPLDTKSWSNAEASRFPKLCPHEVLKEYNYSLYIDSNVVITSNYIYDRASELADDPEALISIPKHPTRDCLYKEAETLKFRGKDKPKVIENQVNLLKDAGFPKDYGLFENNIIWRRHNHPKVVSLDKEWWGLFTKYSKRDQLGLVFFLWKHQIHCTPLMPKSIKDHRKCEHFQFSEHHQKLSYSINRAISKLIYIIKERGKPK